MITRVGRNDVVRHTATGEVGLVKGWADHEKLAQNGTILDVDMGRGRTIQGNGNAFEFVARAKPTWTRAKRWFWGFATLVTMAYGSYFGWQAAQKGLDTVSSVFVGFSAHFFAYYSVKVWTVYPKRVRITLPARVKLTSDRGRGSAPRVSK